MIRVLLVFAALGYLIGSIPFGWLLTRAAGLGDIRAVGSGNIGATNVLRTGRKDVAAATLLLDAGKGAAAVLLAAWWSGGPYAGLWAGVFAVVGHCTSIWMRGQGGKGVATGLGVIAAVAWPVALALCGAWLATAGLARRSSAGALLAFALAPFAMWAWAGAAPAAMTGGVSAIVFVRHADNIRRLRDGTEPLIGQGR